MFVSTTAVMVHPEDVQTTLTSMSEMLQFKVPY